MVTPLIEFRDVTKRFGDKVVLDRVNLKIYEGEVTTIIGLSGAGKSVLLKHIIGLLKPDEGMILFRGKPLNEMGRSEVINSFGKISYMFQGNALFDSLTVYENIALPLRETTKLSKAEIDKRVMRRVEQMELMDAVYKYPSELSGGMQKRVALARALVTDPNIVLFDEPTTGQDPVRKNAILTMIAQYQKRFGFTAVLVSHDIPDVYFISNRILALYDGQIVFQGTPEELENFDHPFSDEVIRSLEELQKELTGLYSLRQFKMQYLSQLASGERKGVYSIIVFEFSGLDEISEVADQEAVHTLLNQFGKQIGGFFGPLAGFSARYGKDTYVTALPYATFEETRMAVEDLITELEKRDIGPFTIERISDLKKIVGVEFFVGIAHGDPLTDLTSVIHSARSQRELKAVFRCNVRGC
ncbi:MAG: ATP-binding cassette domain-containing protein [Syntrophales bacterium]|nr:ATP-binding cassette domain-containing protein [Syntrophales bacterium]